MLWQGEGAEDAVAHSKFFAVGKSFWLKIMVQKCKCAAVKNHFSVI